MSRHRRKRCRRRRLAAARTRHLSELRLLAAELSLQFRVDALARATVTLRGGPLDGQQRSVPRAHLSGPALQFYGPWSANMTDVPVLTYTKRLWRDPRIGVDSTTWEFLP